jgi:hypothetical protein
MKLRALLILSIALNLYLAFIAFSRRPTLQSNIKAAARPTPTVRAYTAAATNTAPPQFNWQSVEADDYHAYIANLRAIGCPEETIQDIVIADVFKLFEERKRQVRAAAPKIPYWKITTRYRGNIQIDANELDRKISEPIDHERNALLRNLGIDPAVAKMPASTLDSRELLLDFLSEEKRRQIIAVWARLRDEQQSMRSGLTPEQRHNAYNNHERDSQVRIKELLTPEEAFQYDLRFSSTANAMRSSLAGFDPTESEFVEIFKLRKAHDDLRRTEMDERGGIPVERINAAQDVLDEQIKNLLGEQRFADYDRTGDSGFQQILNLTEQSGEPTSVAIAAFKTLRGAMGKAYELRQGNMKKDQLNAALDALRTETEASLESTLGSEIWKEHSNGFIFGNSLNMIARRD